LDPVTAELAVAAALCGQIKVRPFPADN